MKKFMKFFAFAAVCLLMAACGSSDEAAAIASRIKDGAQLSEKDYTVMIDYCGKYAEAAQKIQDKINELPAQSEEAGKLTDKLAEMTQNEKYLQVFGDVLNNVSKDAVGEKNVELINKYAPLTWFSAPAWAEVDTTSNVVGSIVDMPSADTAGVIATGDGEVVAQ